MDIKKPASYRYDETLPEYSALLSELLKGTEIEQVFESYYNLTTIPVAIIDLNANVLFSSTWQRICTQFHRVHPTTRSRCIESDTHLALQLAEGKTYSIYTCKNGLTDCASPIVIGGKHVANCFIGQFFIKKPDEAFFRRQAEEFGFDAADYMAALHEVPIVEEEKIPLILELLIRMTGLITNLSIDRKRAIERQARHSIILNTIPQSVFWKDINGRYLGCNSAFAKAAGLATPYDIVGKTDFDLPWPREEAEAYRADDQAVISTKKPRLHIIEPLQQADGARLTVDVSKVPLVGAGNTPYGVVGIYEDITERKQAEEALLASEEKFKKLTEKSLVGIYLLRGGHHKYVNPRFSEIFGYSVDELVSNIGTKELVHPEDLPTVQKNIEKLEKGEIESAHIDFRCIRKDGETIYVDAFGVRTAHEGQPAIIGGLIDITERRRAEEEKERLLSAVETSTDWVLMTDKNGTITYVNEAVVKISGYSKHELLGQNPRIFKSGLYDQQFYEGFWGTILSGRTFRGIITNRRKNGELFEMFHTVTPLRDKNGEITHFVATSKDLTEQRVLEDQIKQIAYYDSLTGLPNKALFEERLNQYIKMAEGENKRIAVLSVDIKRFAYVNEAFGTEVGDKVLKEVGKRISDLLNEGDTVARLESDEFGIAIADQERPEDAVVLVEKILYAFETPLIVDSAEVLLSLAIGIAMYPDDGGDAATLMREAEQVMRSAKEGKKDSYQFFTADINKRASEFVRLERKLYAALEREEFLLHYQPYYGTESREMVGMEALLRWQDPEEGLVSPGRFIPVLEESRLIVDVGQWGLRSVCKQLVKWKGEGFEPVPVAVNFSAEQFKQPDLKSILTAIIAGSYVDPELLTFEITESTFMRDFEYTEEVLTFLKRLGLTVSIDDFGTGYSSLSYLKKLPVDNLKIDMSFIRDIANNPDDASIVSTIISMAHNLGLKTIGEGVETEEQWNILRLLRCDMIQGFYFDRPLPVEDVAQKLKRTAGQ